tara:strand:- start:13232 stop:13897 length:666 start_codon:yes stop_codon:yes gene_type:complete
MSKELAPYRPIELMLDPNVTTSDFTDFIGVWEGFVPKPFCDQLISYGDSVLDDVAGHSIGTGADDIMDGSSMYQGRHRRHDRAFMLNYHSDKWSSQINQFLKSCALHYVDQFPQLKNIGLTSTDIKLQRTPPGGGYHLWHYENGSAIHSQREVTWMIYLNDIEDGGETEFQYQLRRLKPTTGTVVMFPAGMTHVHKGNLVMGERNKYIVTGWYIKSGTSNG